MCLVGILNKVKILVFLIVFLLSIETCVQLNNVMLAFCLNMTPLYRIKGFSRILWSFLYSHGLNHFSSNVTILYASCSGMYASIKF